jgi:Tol biopolymer transport system component
MSSKRRLFVVLSAALLAVVAAGTALSSSTTFKGRNGRLLYQAQVGANTQLFTIKPDGTGVTQITHFKDHSATDANWAPGGSRLVFTQHWDPGGPNEHFLLSTLNADGTGLKALPKAGRLSVGPNWLPDGRRIIYLDVSTGSGRLKIETAAGGPVRLAAIPGSGGDSACSLPGGRVAFLRPQAGSDESRAIFVAGLSGKGLKRVTPWGGYADKIDCSPDGTRVVFSKPEFGQDGKSSNVYTIKTNGTGLVQLTHESGGEINAGADSWSPDGTQVAYVSNKSGTYQIWTMNADGTGAKQLTHGAEAHLAAWGSHP